MPNALVRAAAEGLPSINRRQMLHKLAASSAAATLAMVPAAPAAEHPDADLLRLDQEMLEAETRVELADKVCGLVGREADKLLDRLPPRPAEWKEPSMPDNIRDVLGSVLVRDLPYPERHPAALRDWHRSCEQQRAASRALLEAHQDKVDHIYREAGIDAAEDAYCARAAEVFRVCERILQTPANTAAGILVKLRAAEEINADALTSIVADIRRLAGEAV
ncbi:MAG: hypothetical protein EOR73_10050 [Mesorhizobium sp.]|nr:MAG: hypothetical protein EOR73_10050 [Mesorhizobium sp.]